MPACAALVVAAWGLTLPWMVRNAVEAGHFGISGRAGENLAIRAEYGRMTWGEVRGAFAYYLPDFPGVAGVRDLTMRWAGTRHLRVRPLRSRESAELLSARQAAHRGRRGSGGSDRSGLAKVASGDGRRLDARVGGSDARGRAQARGPDAGVRGTRRPVHSVALAAPRPPRPPDVMEPRSGRRCWRPARSAPHRRFCSFRSPARCCCSPGGAGTSPLRFSCRRWSTAFGIHALATHFMERYARPLLPLLAVVAALAAQEAWRRRGNASPAGSENAGQRLRGATVIRRQRDAGSVRARPSLDRGPDCPCARPCRLVRWEKLVQG